MADLAYPVSYASLGHLLMAQHCHLSLNVFFSPPTVPHPPLLPTQPPPTIDIIYAPTRQLPTDSNQDITAFEKTTSKT